MSLLPKDLYLTFDYFSPLAGDINLKRIGSGPYTRYSTVRDQNHPDYSSVATFTSDSHRGLFPPHGTVQVTVDGPEGRLQSSKMGFQFKYVNGSYLHNSLPRTFKGFSRDISTPYGFNVSIDETLRVSVAQAERLTGLTFTAPSPQSKNSSTLNPSAREWQPPASDADNMDPSIPARTLKVLGLD